MKATRNNAGILFQESNGSTFFIADPVRPAVEEVQDAVEKFLKAGYKPELLRQFDTVALVFKAKELPADGGLIPGTTANSL